MVSGGAGGWGEQGGVEVQREKKESGVGSHMATPGYLIGGGMQAARQEDQEM